MPINETGFCGCFCRNGDLILRQGIFYYLFLQKRLAEREDNEWNSLACYLTNCSTFSIFVRDMISK